MGSTDMFSRKERLNVVMETNSALTVEGSHYFNLEVMVLSHVTSKEKKWRQTGKGAV